MASFLLEIITPEKIVYSENVEIVTAPSSTGVIGILPNHVPLFTRLVEGEVKITKEGDEFFLAIGGGFMEVTKEKVTILVTEAYKAEEINEQELLEAEKRAKKALLEKPTGDALISTQSLFKRSIIGLKVLEKYRKRRRQLG